MTSDLPVYLRSVGRLLGFANAKCRTLSDRRLKAAGLTVQQWIPMTALWRTSPLSESELAEYCQMSASSTSRLLDRMQGKKLVERSTDPTDRRRVLVHVTDHGRSLKHLVRFYEEINDELLLGMTEAERGQLEALLERVIANLDRALE